MSKTNLFLKIFSLAFQKVLIGNPKILHYLMAHRSSPDREEATFKLLKIIVDELNPLINYLNDEDGWLAVDINHIDLIDRLNLNWWKYYENEKKLRALVILVILQHLNKENIVNDSEGDFSVDLSNFFDDKDSNIFASESEYEVIRRLLNNEKIPLRFVLSQIKIKTSCTALLAVSHYCLAYMVHKKTLCQLVDEAKAGNDISFVQAVQIDRSVLQLEYFKKRLLRAQLGSDWRFLDDLGEYIRRPVFTKKIKKHPLLWLTFFILDEECLLDLPRKQLLNRCTELGIYPSGDLNSFKYLYYEYKKTKS